MLKTLDCWPVAQEICHIIVSYGLRNYPSVGAPSFPTAERCRAPSLKDVTTDSSMDDVLRHNRP